MIRILFLSSDPINGDRLKVFEEFNAISRGLRSVLREDEIYIHISGAMSLKDLQSDFLTHNPNIVHFSGHGSINGRLVFKNADNYEGETASIQNIGKLFELDKERISCVILNACYSKEQADEIIKYIDCAIGINNTITDDIATIFSIIFYITLAKGRSIKEAYSRGILQLKYEKKNAEDTIKLMHRKKLNCSDIIPIRYIKESVSEHVISNLVKEVAYNNIHYDFIISDLTSLLRKVPYKISLREFWEEKEKGGLRNVLQNLLDTSTENGLSDREIEDINDIITRVPLILSKLQRYGFYSTRNKAEIEEMEVEILSIYNRALNLLKRFQR